MHFGMCLVDRLIRITVAFVGQAGSGRISSNLKVARVRFGATWLWRVEQREPSGRIRRQS